MKRLSLLLCSLLLLTACSLSPSPTVREFFAMDTVMRITLYDKNEKAFATAQSEIARLEELFSATRSGSDVTRLNQAGGRSVSVSQDTSNLLAQCIAISEKTEGAFDVTVAPAVEAYGFVSGNHRVPSSEEVATLPGRINYTKLSINGNTVTLPANMAVDLGGIGKGYAADRVVEILKEHNCTGGVLSLGGNVLTFGSKPDGSNFTVAVQDPHNAAKTLGVLTFSGGKAIVTSGNYQRYFEQNGVKYHHIIDPFTAAPADSDLTSVTVIAPTATEADGLSTALFVAGLKKGIDFVECTPEVQAVFVTKDNRVVCSTGIKHAFSLTAEEYTIEKRS